MQTINVFLNFNGNTEEVMHWYKDVFGGESLSIQRYREVPGGEKMPAHDQEKILHSQLTLKNGLVIMASDILESMETDLNFGNNFFLCIQAESESESDNFLHKLSQGGSIEMPMNKTFWGAYFGMCTDKFGIKWMINYSYNKA